MGMASNRPAFSYLRVSSTGQADGHGFDRQRSTIQAHAKGRFRILEEFRDEHTGTEEDRPGFASMLAALKSNGVRVIVIESLDRLARSLSVQIALLSMLERDGITLISASTGQDVTADIREDPMREAMVLIQGIFAQTEKKLLVRKLRRAREAKRAKGERVEGRKPYGPGIVAQVRKLRRRKKDGKGWSFARVAAELDRLEIPTKNGNPWAATTVSDLVKGGTMLARNV